jgi:DnaJ like chaperone protein
MWGKLLGAMVGAAIGMILAWSPLLATTLALVGLVLGHLVVDREASAPRLEAPPSAEALLDRPEPPRRGSARRWPLTATPEQQTLADLLCPIFIEVARCDGVVVQPEIRAVRTFFKTVLGFDQAGAEAVRLALKAALAAPVHDVETLVKRARPEIKPSLRLEVVRALYDLGLADADFTRSETDILKRVVATFNLAEEQLQQVTTQYFGHGEDHLRTLGLQARATDDEVRAAFRRLAAEHHPDRAGPLGADQAERAAERFRAVKQAYEELRKIRGF